MHEDKKAPGISRRSIVATAPFVPLVALTAAPPSTESAFSPSQFRLIEAFADRLIPSDENGPGARESGVAVYMDRTFAGFAAEHKPAFLEGLAAIDTLAREKHGAPFAELPANKKDEVLNAMENNEAAGFQPDSRTFFFRIRQLTLEGMFGDPYYGGNQGLAGWDLIRYPGPRMAVSPKEQELRTPIKPLRISARGAKHGN